MVGQTLIIIRHGEKPVDGDPVPGLLSDGTVDPMSLTLRGWQRAGAWAAVFGSGLLPDCPRPTAVYAADPTRSPDGDPPSKRSSQTVTLLAAKLGCAVVLRWARGQEDRLAAEIAERDGVTLVCWEHKRIVTALVPALTGGRTAGIPPKWKRSRFDIIFRLTRRNPGDPWAFHQITPCLLDGDRADPM